MKRHIAKTLLPLIFFIACGSDDAPLTPQTPAVLESVTPASGLEIAVNTVIVLKFDKKPLDFQRDAPHRFRYGAKEREIHLSPLTLGTLEINVSWGPAPMRASALLTYTVTRPDCCAPIMIAGGTVRDGDTDVNAEHINTDGVIEVAFTENVTGTIALKTEAGENVGWIGTVKDTYGRLELVKGREIQNTTTYVVVGKVSDALGNELEFEITFVTKAKV